MQSFVLIVHWMKWCMFSRTLSFSKRDIFCTHLKMCSVACTCMIFFFCAGKTCGKIGNKSMPIVPNWSNFFLKTQDSQIISKFPEMNACLLLTSLNFSKVFSESARLIFFVEKERSGWCGANNQTYLQTGINKKHEFYRRPLHSPEDRTGASMQIQAAKVQTVKDTRESIHSCEKGESYFSQVQMGSESAFRWWICMKRVKMLSKSETNKRMWRNARLLGCSPQSFFLLWVSARKRIMAGKTSKAKRFSISL